VIDAIDVAFDRVDHMIHDLLDANRIRAGERLPLRLATCDLVNLARRAVEEATTTYGDRFAVETGADAVFGIWSEDELYRALWNLITNAVKYGAAAQTITIAVHRRGPHAELSVSNIGAPIPSTEQAHIFDAYARARAADAGDLPGWGLGLTLVRGAAEAHGGRVTLTSDQRSGTTFTIELPLDARRARSDSEDHVTIH
jgi:signal transduction histidine kinase